MLNILPLKVYLKKSKLTSYLEAIALLQRSAGECLITIATRPNISKEILSSFI